MPFCLSVCLSDWYAFSFLKDFAKVAYRLCIKKPATSAFLMLM